jgi:hypothetical protein
MGRRWDGYVSIDPHSHWSFAHIGSAIMDASRRSTSSNTFAAEGEFEGIVRSQPTHPPVNATDFEPMPAFMAQLQVQNVDHVRVVAIPKV